MLPYVDANFRRGLGLMITGLWVTLLAPVFSAFGLAGLILVVVTIVVGGVILARGYEVLTTPPSP